MNRAGLLVLGLALAGPAGAGPDGALDLRALRGPEVGDRRRVTEQVREEGELVVRRGEEGGVVERRTRDRGYRQRYVEVIEHTDARDGTVTAAERTYREAVAHGDGTGRGDEAAAPVEGSRVRVARSPRGTYALERTAADGPLAPALERVLGQEAARFGAARVPPLVWQYERPRVWPVPEEPQRFGDAWAVPLEEAAGLLEVPVEDVRPEASTAEGRLERVEGSGERLRVVVRVELALERFEGRPCPEPVALEAVLTVERPVPAASSAAGPVELSLEGSLHGRVASAGGPPPADEEERAGTEGVDRIVEVDLLLERRLRIEPLE